VSYFLKKIEQVINPGRSDWIERDDGALAAESVREGGGNVSHYNYNNNNNNNYYYYYYYYYLLYAGYLYLHS
jgi:restriction endonuclease S subunit